MQEQLQKHFIHRLKGHKATAIRYRDNFFKLVFFCAWNVVRFVMYYNNDRVPHGYYYLIWPSVYAH